MEEASARRRYSDLHGDRPWHDGTFTNWSSEATEATPYHFEDGVEVYVAETDLAPDDKFLTPLPMFGDQSPEPVDN